MRCFLFNWYKNEKYSEPIERSNLIKADNAQIATQRFMDTFGNLKKNTINFIQEIDPLTGEEIDEAIVPN